MWLSSMLKPNSSTMPPLPARRLGSWRASLSLWVTSPFIEGPEFKFERAEKDFTWFERYFSFLNQQMIYYGCRVTGLCQRKILTERISETCGREKRIKSKSGIELPIFRSHLVSHEPYLAIAVFLQNVRLKTKE